ncbi:hypothetical protein JKP88DRAFT_250847 [Tribonema minus]|uniref:Uncharacterized protein n=1 Tax=Tribonema minus TaxID=303371 RepID=A0A835ZPH0_9STRA|nr:hypothetical protein JKP88DRAFT_250847 [Tribonema minus]
MSSVTAAAPPPLLTALQQQAGDGAQANDAGGLNDLNPNGNDAAPNLDRPACMPAQTCTSQEVMHAMKGRRSCAQARNRSCALPSGRYDDGVVPPDTRPPQTRRAYATSNGLSTALEARAVAPRSLSIDVCKFISMTLSGELRLGKGQQHSVETLAKEMVTQAKWAGGWSRATLGMELLQAGQSVLKPNTGLHDVLDEHHLRKLVTKLAALADAGLRKGTPVPQMPAAQRQTRHAAASVRRALPRRTATGPSAPKGIVRTADAAGLSPPDMPKRQHVNEGPEGVPPPAAAERLIVRDTMQSGNAFAFGLGFMSGLVLGVRVSIMGRCPRGSAPRQRASAGGGIIGLHKAYQASWYQTYVACLSLPQRRWHRCRWLALLQHRVSQPCDEPPEVVLVEDVVQARVGLQHRYPCLQQVLAECGPSPATWPFRARDHLLGQRVHRVLLAFPQPKLAAQESHKRAALGSLPRTMYVTIALPTPSPRFCRPHNRRGERELSLQQKCQGAYLPLLVVVTANDRGSALEGADTWMQVITLKPQQGSSSSALIAAAYRTGATCRAQPTIAQQQLHCAAAAAGRACAQQHALVWSYSLVASRQAPDTQFTTKPHQRRQKVSARLHVDRPTGQCCNAAVRAARSMALLSADLRKARLMGAEYKRCRLQAILVATERVEVALEAAAADVADALLMAPAQQRCLSCHPSRT